MKSNLKILLAALLLTLVFTAERVCEHKGFGQAMAHRNLVVNKAGWISGGTGVSQSEGTITNDPRFSRKGLESVSVDMNSATPPRVVQAGDVNSTTEVAEPIEVTWNMLMNIEYELRYFSEVDMEMLAPIFPDSIKALDGKEVVCEGYVIPFDTEREVLALSANPYASCFFCGQAGPATVMSLYLKDPGTRFMIDEHTKFRGILHLNSDDPADFYYVLRDAREE